MRSLAVLGVALAFCLAAPARASDPPSTYYVDPEGVGGECSDSRANEEARSPKSPWCRLERALETVRGDAVVFVRQAELDAVELTTEDAGGVLVRSFPDEIVRLGSLTFDGASGLRVRGMTLGGVILNAGTSNVTLEENLIQSPNSTGVTFSADAADAPIEDVIIRHNRFDGIGVDAIQAKNFRRLRVEGNEFTNLLARDDGAHPDAFQTVFGGQGLVFTGNWIHDYEAQGFFLADGAVRGVKLENNLIEESYGDFAELSVTDATDVAFRSNTVRGLTRFSGDTSGVRIANNVLDRLLLDGTEGLEIEYEDHNLIESGGGEGPNDLEGDPEFADSLIGDFELEGQSPAIDAGSASDAPVLDMFGRSRRGRPDMGALEHEGIIFEGLPLTLLPLRLHARSSQDGRVLVRCSRACSLTLEGFDADGDRLGQVEGRLERAGRTVLRLPPGAAPALVQVRASDRAGATAAVTTVTAAG